MRLRIRKYLSSPLGIYFRIKRDLPFWLRGTSFYADLEKRQPPVQSHEPRHESSVIETYWNQHGGRTNKSAVYTCITNGYDDLDLIANHKYVDPNWDYICFTDDQSQIAQNRVGIWQIRPLSFSNADATRINRWHKMHPHILLPDYTESIYIDANIDILTPYLFQKIVEFDKDFILPRHDTRTCIYQEFELFLSEFTEETEKITAEWKFLRKSGMPRNFGMTENNILYRRHNSPSVIQLMEQWWEMVNKYSRRDQLSLPYLLWKSGADLSRMTFPNARRLPDDFCVFRHTAKPNQSAKETN